MTLYEQMMKSQQPQVNPQAVASIKRMQDTLKGVSNPAQVMNMLASQNPLVGQVMKMANGSASYKDCFMQACQQQGQNPNDILAQLK